MVKYFCDKCGEEITDKNMSEGGTKSEGRLGVEIEYGKHTLAVEVINSLDGCANAGLFCKYCILDALYQLDDRPKATCPNDKVSDSRE